MGCSLGQKDLLSIMMLNRVQERRIVTNIDYCKCIYKNCYDCCDSNCCGCLCNGCESVMPIHNIIPTLEPNPNDYFESSFADCLTLSYIEPSGRFLRVTNRSPYLKKSLLGKTIVQFCGDDLINVVCCPDIFVEPCGFMDLWSLCGYYSCPGISDYSSYCDTDMWHCSRYATTVLCTADGKGFVENGFSVLDPYMIKFINIIFLLFCHFDKGSGKQTWRTQKNLV
ncbi:hypothetical protein HELRODRAFT_193013 [Helobdella robusta]|uniref:Uncharacterized protein n=1 Tax=Helobdella robusta TaxID=6412 RepID=T1FUI6_HELRO|nr:hypothetical protein HELRODRAFT_193013 [Helobdella robusta]ESN98245.1 hypothetical protein HELRODRAFT_193013 [Helobdella robusta]